MTTSNSISHPVLLAGTVALTLLGGVALLAQPAASQTPSQQQIYGSQMMTDQERNEYRDRMRSADTAEEREKIRSEHHEAMQQRAKERGVTLPDAPPMPGMGQGRGIGPGGGMGGGMGPGGMGPGGVRRGQ